MTHSQKVSPSATSGSDSIHSTDISWPLFLHDQVAFSLGYIQTEGLELATPDRYTTEAAALGGREVWLEAWT